MRSRSRRRPSAHRPADDRGAVLLLTIVLLLVGSLIVGGLASYSVSALKAMPTAKSRTNRVESVKSAVRMAMTLQRDGGPAACFATTTAYTINNIPVTVTCSSSDAYSSGNDRYGVITTANANSVNGLTGRVGSTFAKLINGKLLFNAGLLSGVTDIVPNNSQIEMSRYQSANTPLARYKTSAIAVAKGCDDPTIGASDQYPKTPATHTLSCTNEPWWNLAGDLNGTTRQYPLLPQLPSYQRDGSLATDRHAARSGTPAATRRRRVHPHAHRRPTTSRRASTTSSSPISISSGATVVMGEGKYRGCVFDTDAAYRPHRPEELTRSRARVRPILLGKGANDQRSNGGGQTHHQPAGVERIQPRFGGPGDPHQVSFGTVDDHGHPDPGRPGEVGSNGSLQPVSPRTRCLIGTGGQKSPSTRPRPSTTSSSTALADQPWLGTDSRRARR